MNIALVMRRIGAYHLCSEHAAAILIHQTSVVVLFFTIVRMKRLIISQTTHQPTIVGEMAVFVSFWIRLW